MSLAVVVIASEKRKDTTFPRVMDSVLAVFGMIELVVVADFPATGKWRHLVVEPMLRNTMDALVKRDVGWLATSADNVCFLCDDHALPPDFLQRFSPYASMHWDFLAPSRFCVRDGEKIWLNVGRNENYIGGHCGIYRRSLARFLPWSAGPHHPNWDVLHSHLLLKAGARLQYADTDLAVEDIEPNAQPWI